MRKEERRKEVPQLKIIPLNSTQQKALNPEKFPVDMLLSRVIMVFSIHFHAPTFPISFNLWFLKVKASKRASACGFLSHHPPMAFLFPFHSRKVGAVCQPGLSSFSQEPCVIQLCRASDYLQSGSQATFSSTLFGRYKASGGPGRGLQLPACSAKYAQCLRQE